MSNNQKQTILIVDDTAFNLEVLAGILSDDYHVKLAKSGAIALKITEKFRPDLILLDIMMPDMDGYEVCLKLKENPILKSIPIIFVSAKDQDTDEAKGFKLGAVDYITKPVSSVIVKARVRTHLALYDQQRELSRQVFEQTKLLNETRLKTINMLGIASEYKDKETGTHIISMSTYCYLISKACGFSEEEAQVILHASPMHDLGKIAVPDHILQKPGPLSEEEFEIMKNHCVVGEKILMEEDSEIFKVAAIIARQHHEKWNGLGYPDGLKNDEINIFARIAAVADVFDALTTRRPYKNPWDIDQAIDYIISQKGEQFDPSVVSAFESIIDQITEVHHKYKV